MTTLTTAGVAAEIVATFVSQGVALADESVAASQIASHLTAWLGGEDAVPADLSLKLSGAIGNINLNALQELDWWTGTVDGGPDGDGLYDRTNAAGVTTKFPCLAKIFATVGTVGDPAAVVDEVTTLVGEAEAARTGSETARDETLGAIASLPSLDNSEALEESGISFDDPAGDPALVATDQRLESPTFKATPTEIIHPAFQALQAAVPQAPTEALETGIAFDDPAGEPVLVATDQRLESPTFKATPTEIIHPAIQALQAVVPQGPAPGVETGVSFDDPSGDPALVATDQRLETPTFKATLEDIVHPAFQHVAAEVAYANVPAVERYKASTPLTQILQILTVGQSLSKGGSSNPAISLATLAYALMFNGGTGWVDDPATVDIPANHASLTALVEAGRESPSYGMAVMLAQLAAADGFGFGSAFGQSLLLSNPGVSGASVAQLSGSPHFDCVEADIEYGRALADAADQTCSLAAMPVMQGEGNYGTDRETWIVAWRAYKARILDIAETVYGARREVITPLYQQAYTHTSRNIGIPLAQLALAQEAGWGLALPLYFLDKVADGQHLTPQSSKWMGAYFGRFIFEWLWRGNRMKPLVPFSATRIGSAVVLQFPVTRGLRLELDTAQVPQATNYGFELFEADGVTAITLTGVAITGRDTVSLITADPVPEGAIVIYGRNGDGTDMEVNLRGYSFGNLRDNDPLIFDPAGLNKPMHTWAPIFSMEIA